MFSLKSVQDWGQIQYPKCSFQDGVFDSPYFKCFTTIIDYNWIEEGEEREKVLLFFSSITFSAKLKKSLIKFLRIMGNVKKILWNLYEYYF